MTRRKEFMATIANFPESSESTKRETQFGRSTESRASEIQDGIRSIQNYNWRSLFNTISVVLLLTAAIVCLTLPTLVEGAEPFAQVNIDLAVRGLVGVVLLFNIYAGWQQIRLKKLCDDLKESLRAIASK
jgi:hypothetical protein